MWGACGPDFVDQVGISPGGQVICGSAENLAM
jgi:hypothetical protein